MQNCLCGERYPPVVPNALFAFEIRSIAHLHFDRADILAFGNSFISICYHTIDSMKFASHKGMHA